MENVQNIQHPTDATVNRIVLAIRSAFQPVLQAIQKLTASIKYTQPDFATTLIKNYGNLFATVGYAKNGAGEAVGKGMIQTTGSVALLATLYTLPSGLRPAEQRQFSVKWNGSGVEKTGTLQINPDGTVRTGQALANGDILALEFRLDAEQ